MFCFTRRAGQKLRIGDEILLSVQRIRGGSVRLGFEVPPDMAVDREEVAEFKKRERIAANLKHVAEQKPSARVAKPVPASKSAARSRANASATARKPARKKSADHTPRS